MIRPDFTQTNETWRRDASGASILGAIHEPGVELALWRRMLPAHLRGWLADLPADQLPDGRVLCHAKDLRAATASLLRPASPMQDLLLDDIVKLGRLFARVSGSDLMDLRLERIDDDGCAAFHRDRVALRLLTTYRGPGTQWVAPRYADQALAAQRDYAGPIEHAPLHAVAMVRGAEAVGALGLAHRSPPIERTGATRLLLCLNTPSDVSPAPWRLGDGVEDDH